MNTDKLERRRRARGTKIEIEARVQQVRKFLLEGKSSIDIGSYGSESWNLSSRQTRKYIRRAAKEISKSLEDDFICTLEFHIDARKNLLAYATHISDFKLALSILQDIAKLSGLYVERSEIDITSKGKIVHDLSPELQEKIDGIENEIVEESEQHN